MLDRLSKHDRWWGLTHKDALVNWTKMSVEAALTNAIYGYTVMFAKLNDAHACNCLFASK